jgi:hypothetical protein
MFKMWLPLFAFAAVAFSFAPEMQRVLGDGHLSDVSTSQLAENPELPGGSPMSLCKESSPSDLFKVSSVELSRQPLYMCVHKHFIYNVLIGLPGRDDLFDLNVYGTFQNSETWTESATLTLKVDCGSHCEMY